MRISSPEEDGQFVTACSVEHYLTGEICGGQLYLVNASVQPNMGDVPILLDGFDLSGSTSNEVVRCIECGHMGPLEVYTYDE